MSMSIIGQKPQPWCPGLDTADPLLPGLQQFLTMWSGGGSRVMDISGGSHHVQMRTNNTPRKVWATGNEGVVADMQSFQAYFHSDEPLKLVDSDTRACTLYARVRAVTPVATSERAALAMGGTGSHKTVGFMLRYLDGNSPAIVYARGDTFEEPLAASTVAKFTDYVYTADEDHCCVYIDGELLATTTASDLPATFTDLYWGAYTLANGSPYKTYSHSLQWACCGQWDRVLSAAEVRMLTADPYRLMRNPTATEMPVSTLGGIASEQADKLSRMQLPAARPAVWCPGFNAEHPLAKQVTGYWPGWDSGGNRIMDLIGNNHAHFALNETTPAAPVWEPTPAGVMPTGERFVRYIGGGAPMTPPQTGDANRTYSFRLRGTLSSVDQTPLFVFGDYSHTRNIGLELWIPSSGTPQLRATYFSGRSTILLDSPEIDAAFAITTCKNKMCVYMDGRLLTSVSASAISMPASAAFLWGSATLGGNSYMSSRSVWEDPMADMIECRGYAATPEEIQYLHDNPWGLCQPAEEDKTARNPVISLVGRNEEQTREQATTQISVKPHPEVWSPGLNTEHPLIDKVTGYWPGWDGGGNRIMDLVGGKHAHFARNEITPVTPVWEPTELGVLPISKQDVRYVGGGAPMVVPQPGDADRTYFWRAKYTTPYEPTPSTGHAYSSSEPLQVHRYIGGTIDWNLDLGVRVYRYTYANGDRWDRLRLHGPRQAPSGPFMPPDTVSSWRSYTLVTRAGGVKFYFDGRLHLETNRPIEATDVLPHFHWGVLGVGQAAGATYAHAAWDGPMADMIECRGYAATPEEIQYLHDNPFGLCDPVFAYNGPVQFVGGLSAANQRRLARYLAARLD